MSTLKITRHFATIKNGRWGDRQVHYRRIGTGPLVICFHQSPLSSRDMVSTMELWKNDFTCIAPDSPGFGLSDALKVNEAQMEDFADAAIEFFDAIGVKKAAVYGFHTGAMIAAAVAAAYPDRITCAASNGYVLLNGDEREDILKNYLPEYVPSWDGSHLTWLWARMREQTIFFPWYRKGQPDRLDFDLPSPEALHTSLLDFMRSGDNYRVGYRAAFSMRSDLTLRHMQIPTLITASKFDVLASHLSRIRQKSVNVTVREGGTSEDTLDLCRDFIKNHKPPAAPQIKPPAEIPGRLWQDYVNLKEGQLRIHRNDDATGRPVLVQHDAAGSSEIVGNLAAGFIGKRPVIAINLPGHGESDNTFPSNNVTVTSYALAVLEVIDVLKLKEIDFIGTWGGGLVGLELAALAPNRLKHLVMADVLYFDETLRNDLKINYTPDIKPNWFGGHLLEAWHLIRDQGLFWPWYDRTKRGIIRQPLYIDPMMINARVLELFRSNGMWRQAYQAHFNYPLKEKLSVSKIPLLFVAPSWDPQLDVTQQAARDFPRAPFVKMPDTMNSWAENLIPFLSGLE